MANLHCHLCDGTGKALAFRCPNCMGTGRIELLLLMDAPPSRLIMTRVNKFNGLRTQHGRPA